MTYINERISKKIKKIGLIHNAYPHENSLFSSFFLKRYLRSLNEYVTFSKVVKEHIEKMETTVFEEKLEKAIFEFSINPKFRLTARKESIRIWKKLFKC